MSREQFLTTLPSIASASAYVGFNSAATAFQAYNNFQLNGGAVTGQAYTTPLAVSSSSTITLNAAGSNVFEVGALSSNFTLSIAGGSAGQTIIAWLTQDSTGSRIATWSGFKWANGSAPSLSTAANAVDLLIATYRSTGYWYGTLVTNYS